MQDFFNRHGYCIVRSALSPEAVASFVAATAHDLATGQHSEVPALPSILLDDSATWPRKRLGTHRVVEVVPPGTGPHWSALSASGPLASALDTLVGAGAWELSLNAEPLGTRHWYLPITFPEAPEDAPAGGIVESGRSESPADAASAEQRPSLSTHPCLMGPLAELAQVPPMCDAVRSCASDAARAALWQPINRRRVVGRGWHIDVGPGFPNDGLRTTAGDPRQGVVLLPLLSDCAPGGGGTALVPGSHGWVYSRLQRAAAAATPAGGGGGGGMTHSALNEWVVARMRAAVEAGVVQLAVDSRASGSDGCRTGGAATDAPAVIAWGPDGPADGGPMTAVQVVGRAGDVVLMHPLLVHGGTTNLSARTPRLMANGVARTSTAAFAAGGCPMMRVAAAAAAAMCDAITPAAPAATPAAAFLVA